MPIGSLEDLKSAVNSVDNADEIIEFVINSIESEKQRGIDSRRQANNEAKNLRKFKLALEKLGYSNETDLDEYVDSLLSEKEELAAAGVTEGGVSEVMQQLKRLRKDFEKTQQELKSERDNAQQLRADSDRKAIKSRLTDALRDKVYGHDLLAEHLISNGQVTLEGDEVIFIDGDDQVDFDQGVASLLEKRTDILKNGQKPGGGTTPSTSTKQKFSREQIASMSLEEVRANLQDIKQSLNIRT